MGAAEVMRGSGGMRRVRSKTHLELHAYDREAKRSTGEVHGAFNGMWTVFSQWWDRIHL